MHRNKWQIIIISNASFIIDDAELLKTTSVVTVHDFLGVYRVVC